MKICVVIVTFNKLECLKKALICYEEQSKLPQCVIVVNNNSTDGTRDYLEKWALKAYPFQKIVINLPQNTGGAGGFHCGMEKALTLECDWIWVSDDDAYPESNALESIENFVDSENYSSEIVGLCGTIMDYDHEHILLGHHCVVKKIIGIPIIKTVPEEKYKKEYFDLDLISYVGSAFKKDILKKIGTTREDFFIYSDDWEHSMRIRKEGRIACVPNSCVLHVGESTLGVRSNKPSWRDYYTTRNTLFALKKHYGNISFIVRSVCRLLTAFSSFNLKKIEIFCLAIHDAFIGKMGIHPIFKPGWEYTKNAKNKF